MKSFELTPKDAQCEATLPDQFNLKTIQNKLTEKQIVSLKKLHELWRLGISMYVYGSFVAECAYILLGNYFFKAHDIDSASEGIDEKDLKKTIDIITSVGLKKKAFIPNPRFKQTFYPFEFETEQISIDFTIHLLSFVNGPNALVLSSFQLYFVKGESDDDICFKFGENKLLLEQLCKKRVNPIGAPAIDERGVLRRILKQIKNHRELYKNQTLSFYFENQKITNFTEDDPGWIALNAFIKVDFKRKIGTKYHMSLFNEMRRLVSEETFCMPEATLFVKNFFQILLQHHYETHWHIKKDMEQESIHMATLMKEYFLDKPKEADSFYNVVNHLLRYASHLSHEDNRMLPILAKQLTQFHLHHSERIRPHKPTLFHHKMVWRPVKKSESEHVMNNHRI